MHAKLRSFALATALGIVPVSSAYAAYDDVLADERKSIDHYLSVRSVLQFLGIVVETSQTPADRAIGSAAQAITGVQTPDSAENLKNTVKAQQEYRKAYDDVTQQLGTYFNNQ